MGYIIEQSSAKEKLGDLIINAKEKEIIIFMREQGHLDFKGNRWILMFHLPEKVIFAPAIQLGSKLLIISTMFIFWQF